MENKIRVLHISSSDIMGGASRAAYRLNKALRKIDVESKMLVNNKISSDDDILSAFNYKKKLVRKIYNILAKIILVLAGVKDTANSSLNIFPSGIYKLINSLSVDIIHLHWINAELISIFEISKINKPLVWTFHDMWAFTGVEHYSRDFNIRSAPDGDCGLPKLFSKGNFDLNYVIWKMKYKQWKNVDFNIVTPSAWLSRCTEKSKLMGKYPITIIPNCIDLNVFRPKNKLIARERLLLPLDKKLILFGAVSSTSDPRKGFNLLVNALKYLRKIYVDDDVELVVFGESSPIQSNDIFFPTHLIGEIKDEEKIVDVYSAADVFVAPSLIDNLPNTIVESLACGRPCVAFEVGGIPDLIRHKLNGYLARPFDVKDLANGIAWVISGHSHKLEARSRDIAEQNFNEFNVANKHLHLYNNIIGG